MDTSRIRWIIQPGENDQPPTLELLAGDVPVTDSATRYAYWTEQDTAAKWAATSALVEHYLRQNGRDNELCMQRSVVRLSRRSAA